MLVPARVSADGNAKLVAGEFISCEFGLVAMYRFGWFVGVGGETVIVLRPKRPA
jgi:hypothetical protein